MLHSQSPVPNEIQASGKGPGEDRWIDLFTGWPMLAASALLAVVCAWSRIITSSAWSWNDIRLVRSRALADGLSIYPSLGDGALIDVVYGPLSLPFYVPAAWLAQPKWALLAGVATSFVIVGGVTAWLLWSERFNGGAEPLMRCLALSLAFYHLYFSEAISGAWIIHVDAVALAICALAASFAIIHQTSGGKWGYLAGSAVLAGLAPWAKQSVAPVIVALALYFWLRGGIRPAAWFTLISLTTAVAAGAGFSVYFGFDEMLLSMYQVPIRHSWNWRTILGGGDQVRDLLDMAAVGGVALMTWYASRTANTVPSPRQGVRGPGQYSWLLYTGIAFALAPTSIIARIKEGGYLNNYGYIDYFLMLAALLAFLRASARPSLRLQTGYMTGTRLVLMFLLAIQMVRAVPGLLDLPKRSRALLRRNPSEMAFEYARRHPGEVYFPWNPYAAYRAEGKLYHVGHAVLDRTRAGMPISEDHFHRYLPVAMKYIALPPGMDRKILARLPEFNCEAKLEGLDGWDILARCDGQSPPAGAGVYDGPGASGSRETH